MNANPFTPPPAPDADPGAGHWLGRQRVLLAWRIGAALALARRGWASIGNRGLRTTLRLVVQRLVPARRQPFTLRLHRAPVDVSALRIPRADPPRASIVVPVHGKLDLTLGCLRALAESGDATPFEVIVVDDASTDSTPQVLPEIAGLRYTRHGANVGFIGACNAGAAMARGEFVVFLNNDTLVQPRWLDALLGTFTLFPDTGLAGSKLVYPDGRLQEAGGLVYRSGRAANYGRFGDPTDPRFNYVREADYCSGAALAIPTALFRQLGGFDRHYQPAYYEDTDLGMRVREAGWKVRYQPASVVVHLEGASAGTDPRKGMKAWQPVNEARFRERWASRLPAQPADPDLRDVDGRAADRAARGQRPRVLVLDAYTPTPDRDSGSLRMAELLSLLVEEGCAVSFLSQGLTHEGPYTQALQQLGVECWWQPWVGALPRWLRRHGPQFDAIIASRHYVLAPLLPMLRELAPQARIVFDTVDLHFLREQREAEHAGAAADARARDTRRSELALVGAVDETWVVSPVERDLLAELAPGAAVAVVSNIHRVQGDTPGFADRADIVFVGGFRHPPNVDAALWLGREILLHLRERLPGARVHVVGADAPPAVQALAGADLLVHGHVPALEALLDGCRIAVAPLRYGAGIKGKVNQALARGLPVVATTCAVEGMALADGRDVLVADDAQAFADAIARLHQDEGLWLRLRAGGYANTAQHFSADAARQALQGFLARLRARTGRG